jgi:hypothetical protein
MKPSDQIFCKIMDIQYAFLAVIGIIAERVYSHIFEIVVLGQPFLWPKKARIFILRPSFPNVRS